MATLGDFGCGAGTLGDFGGPTLGDFGCGGAVLPPGWRRDDSQPAATGRRNAEIVVASARRVPTGIEPNPRRS